mmetsp:Transcript_10233/g.22121  ORF Transcript_10233/g.22121 Transcript_10233/m.22121 type:complete len:114 (-) Transcript_10233:680-1021(-)
MPTLLAPTLLGLWGERDRDDTLDRDALVRDPETEEEWYGDRDRLLPRDALEAAVVREAVVVRDPATEEWYGERDRLVSRLLLLGRRRTLLLPEAAVEAAVVGVVDIVPSSVCV